MKIKYESVIGEVTEVEVSGDIGEFIIESRRLEENLNRKERNHCYSSDGIDFEGAEFGCFDTYEIEKDTSIEMAFSKLSDVQKRRLLMLANGLSMREIARQENVDIKTVRESIEGGRKKFLKFF